MCQCESKIIFLSLAGLVSSSTNIIAWVEKCGGFPNTQKQKWEMKIEAPMGSREKGTYNILLNKRNQLDKRCYLK